MVHFIVDIIFASSALFFLFKFLIYKKSAEEKLKMQEERLELELLQKSELESKYQSGGNGKANNQSESIASDEKNQNKNQNQNNNPTIESLIAEINNLHDKNEQETQLRMEAEKKIALALQKTQNVEQRLEDWKMIQDANLKDAINAMIKIGDNLRQRLLKDISDLPNNKSNNNKSNNNKSNNDRSYMQNHNINNSHNSKNNIKIYQDDLEKMLKNKNFLPRKNYFINSMIDPKYAKSVPCEAFIILDQENCLIIDFKSLKIFEALGHNKIALGEEKAYKIFQEKIEQYINYLTNPKYKSNELSYFAKNKVITQNAQSVFLMFISKMADIEELKKLDEEYLQKLENNNIYLYDLQNIADSIDAVQT